LIAPSGDTPSQSPPAPSERFGVALPPRCPGEARTGGGDGLSVRRFAFTARPDRVVAAGTLARWSAG